MVWNIASHHPDRCRAVASLCVPYATLERGWDQTIALVDRKARDEIEQVVRDIEKVETAVEADFQRHFVDAMALPHRTDPYPNLARTFELPAQPEPAASGRRRRRPA